MIKDSAGAEIRTIKDSAGVEIKTIKDSAGGVVFQKAYLLLFPSNFNWRTSGSGGGQGSGSIANNVMTLSSGYNCGFKYICATPIDFSQYSKMIISYNVVGMSNAGLNRLAFQTVNTNMWDNSQCFWMKDFTYSMSNTETIDISNLNATIQPIFGVHTYIYDWGPLTVQITKIELTS